MVIFGIRLRSTSEKFSFGGFLLACLVSGLLAFSGCDDGQTDIPLDEVNMDLQVYRLDEELYAASKQLAEQGNVAPKALFDAHFQDTKGFVTDWMFGGNDSIATDSLVGQAMMEFAGDSHGRQLLDSIHTKLGGIDLKAMLEPPLKRYKYYFPDKGTPVVVGYVDGFPPTAQAGMDQIFISPTYLGIGLHYFMGPQFRYYPEDLPKYIRRRCTPEHIASIVVHKLADGNVPPPDISKNPVLIDFVICEGIKMYFVDKLLGPAVHDTIKLFYQAEQMDWANLYEGRVYKDLVAELYNGSAELQRRYIEDSPFTSQLNRASAPRLGQFIGWRIVKAYMEKHPETSLDALVQMRDFQKLFKDSGYRPPRSE
jgi:hypothetical protein